MIEISDAARGVMTTGSGSIRHCRVESWLGGELLADNVPISAGRETVDNTSQVPEHVTITVPRLADGYDWSPLGDPLHPLAANGQRLRVMLGVELTAGAIEWLQRGEYLIDDVDVAGDDVVVQAVGLLALIAEARLVTPYQPTSTLGVALRQLCEPAVTVEISSSLVDRAVPSGINFDEDRLGAVREIIDAWPAAAAMTNLGYLSVYPATTAAAGDVDYILTDNVAIEHVGQSSREGIYNAVVARGTAPDGGQVQGVAYDYSVGPTRYGGPFNPLPVPLFFQSPLLTTVAQCRAAAATRLARLQRENGRPFRVSVPPLIHVQAGDVVSAYTDRGRLLCTVEGTALPFLPDGGPMTLILVEVLQS
jgi:hypothetical protein